MWTHLGYVPTFYQCYTKLKAYIFLPKEPKRNISFTQCNTLKHNKDINGYNVKFNL